MRDTELFSGERLDQIGFGGLKLIQKPEEFCYGVDAVILANFAAKHCKGEPQSVVDLGTGTGVIPLILSHKTKAKNIIGVEVQKPSFERAKRNIKLNSLEERLSIINGDVKDIGEIWGRDLKGTVDVVVANPPYFKSGSSITNGHDAKAMARHETTAGLEEFLSCAAYLLKLKGDFFMVHRPSRLADICYFGRTAGLEPKEMIFVSPTEGETPNILLIHMVKGAGSELKILPHLYVYDKHGEYTEDLLEAYESTTKNMLK